MQLAKEDATKMYVTLPSDVEPQHVKKLADLEARMKSLEESTDSMLVSQRLHNKLALRQLLDDARNRLAGHQLAVSERGEVWNQFLESMPSYGVLSCDAAFLTRFGPGTQQHESSIAAHSISQLAIAEAVAALPQKGDLYRELYTFVYGTDLNQLLFELQ